MKIIITIIGLACLSPAALADDLVTPTPTPIIYLKPAGRPNTIRRLETLERRHERQAAFESKKEVRAQKRADRVAIATAEAQTRNAARAREKAQREVAAQARAQSATEKPHLTSDLMIRMGFSQEDIAAQKAREQSSQSEDKEKASISAARP